MRSGNFISRGFQGLDPSLLGKANARSGPKKQWFQDGRWGPVVASPLELRPPPPIRISKMWAVVLKCPIRSGNFNSLRFTRYIVTTKKHVHLLEKNNGSEMPDQVLSLHGSGLGPTPIRKSKMWAFWKARPWNKIAKKNKCIFLQKIKNNSASIKEKKRKETIHIFTTFIFYIFSEKNGNMYISWEKRWFW